MLQHWTLATSICLLDEVPNYFSLDYIAIIHHSGIVTGNDTRGHYRADVKNQLSNTWYRTSDNDRPQKLSSQSVTKTGYIFLYKQTGAAEPMEEDVQGSSN